MAQSAEHILGKDEVVGSIPTISSSGERPAANPPTVSSVGGFLCRITQVLYKAKVFDRYSGERPAANPSMVFRRRVIFSPVSPELS